MSTNICKPLFQRCFSSPIQSDTRASLRNGCLLGMASYKRYDLLKKILWWFSIHHTLQLKNFLMHFNAEAKRISFLFPKRLEFQKCINYFKQAIYIWVQSSFLGCLLLWNISLHLMRLKCETHPSLHYSLHSNCHHLTYYIFYVLILFSFVCLPPRECELPEGKRFCLFYSLLIRQHLKQYLEHSRHSELFVERMHEG